MDRQQISFVLVAPRIPHHHLRVSGRIVFPTSSSLRQLSLNQRAQSSKAGAHQLKCCETVLPACAWLGSRLPRQFYGKNRRGSHYAFELAIVAAAPSSHSSTPSASEGQLTQGVAVAPERPFWSALGGIPTIGGIAILLGVIVVIIRKALLKKKEELESISSLFNRKPSMPLSVPVPDKKDVTAAVVEQVTKSPERPAWRPLVQTKDMLNNRARRYIFVGGKGGVGKTTTSAAIALKFADMGQKTLLISTDPAHSLSDVFDSKFRSADNTPVRVPGTDRLYCLELDPEKSKQSMGSLDTGFEGIGDLFETLPPGIDEAVALASIVNFIQSPEYADYDRIIFDTAPTGHTLRLLQLPEFLDSLYGKLMKLKLQMGSMAGMMKNMFGMGDPNSDKEALEGIEDMKRSMEAVRALLKDPTQTEFIIVTIPNMMAIAESERLADQLRAQEVPLRQVVINQIMPPTDASHCAFCAARAKDHESNVQYIQTKFAFKGVKLTQVQCYDAEIRGLYALKAVGQHLFPADDPPKPRSGSGSESEPAGAQSEPAVSSS